MRKRICVILKFLLKGNGQDFDYINVPMAVHTVGQGFSDVLCGNGNICGRNTTGPGICCKYQIYISFSIFSSAVLFFPHKWFEIILKILISYWSTFQHEVSPSLSASLLMGLKVNRSIIQYCDLFINRVTYKIHIWLKYSIYSEFWLSNNLNLELSTNKWKIKLGL